MTYYCTDHSVEVVPSDYDLPEWGDGEPLVIFGSRSVSSRPGSVREWAKWVVARLEDRDMDNPDLIISGGADGADAVAEVVAILLGVPMVVFAVGEHSEATHRRREFADSPWAIRSVTSYAGPDDNPRSGNGAYTTWNCLIAEFVARRGGSGFALWDGSSPGTRRMLDSCESHGVETVPIWRFDRDDPMA